MYSTLHCSFSGKPGFGSNLCKTAGGLGRIGRDSCGVVPYDGTHFPAKMFGLTYCCCFKPGGKKSNYCNDPAKANKTWPYWFLGPQTKAPTIISTTTHIPTGITTCLEGKKFITNTNIINYVSGNTPRPCKISVDDGNYPKNCYNKYKISHRDVYNAKVVDAGCDDKQYCVRNKIETGKCDTGIDENGYDTIFCCCDDYENCNIPSLRPAYAAPKGMKSCLEGNTIEFEI